VRDSQWILAVQSVLRVEPTGTDFLSSISSPDSYITRNFGKPIALIATCFHAGFLLYLLFDPKDEGNIFIRNIR
jgi:hypothetical protein